MTLDVRMRQLIAHQVPRPVQGDTTAEPQLSEAVPDLPLETLTFFGRRLVRSLSDRGQEVEVDPRFDDPRMPKILGDALSTEELDLVAPSVTAARYLLEVQPGSAYERQSLFVMGDAVANGQASIALLKLEREEGVHVHSRTIDGKVVLDVEVLEDLMLTDSTRVFKAGLFWKDQNTLKGIVSDDQQSRRADPARYFLERFLGCRLRRSPALVTRDFYEAAEKFISTEVGDGERKLQYLTALQAELSSNRTQIDPVQFAHDHLVQEDRARFETYLQQAGVPAAAFDKDLDRLVPRLKKSRLKTASGITISGATQAMTERVSVIHHDGGPAILIRDSVIEV